MTGTKPRVAVLGGGVGSMAAAFWLSQPGWRDRFESITVHQLGFRLGGKGASGRNVRCHSRIEEHGLHVWLGFYENAFRTLDQCYRELARSHDVPIRTISDAFEKSNTIVAQEWRPEGWANWVVEFPENDELPWAPVRPLPNLFECLVGTLKLAREYLRSARRVPDPALAGAGLRLRTKTPKSAAGPLRMRAALPPPGTRVVSLASDVLMSLERDAGVVVDLALACALEIAETIAGTTAVRDDSRHDELLRWIDEAARAAHRWLYKCVERDDEARRYWQLADVLLACARGVIKDRLLFAEDGLDAIDDIEFMDWLVMHGAKREAAFCAPIKASLYDMAFAYRDGDGDKPCGSAGQAVRGLFRLFFAYRGSINWKMRAGMGDVVFAPLYDLLVRRGVRFEFFHKVEALRLSADGKRIAAIEIGVQAEPRDTASGYDPLIDVKGLRCWPSEPLTGRLTDAGGMTAYDAESFWSRWPTRPLRLEDGKDFDIVLLGISIASLPFICADVIEASPAWRNMVENVATVQTQAVQIWTRQNPEELGWDWLSGSTSGFVEPFDSAANMHQTLDREDWPNGAVGGVLYFCNALPTPNDSPDPNRAAYPAEQTAIVKRNGLRFLARDVGVLLPRAMVGYPDDFRWEVLVDDLDRTGPGRFDAQFWRANVDPSERYVQAIPGTTKYRLSPGASGFENLYLAGDWTHTGLDVGCVESAATSGMLAANAICGIPSMEMIADHGVT